MREIVTIQVGGGGNAIANEFFSVICQEHGLSESGSPHATNSNQMERISVFFSETRKKSYFARAIAVDTDARTINAICQGNKKNLYRPRNLINGVTSAANNFGIGYGAKQLNKVMESLRAELESADSVQGIQLIHTLGGGTGSGLTAAICEHISDEYGELITETVSIIPSSQYSEIVTEPYNCMLCLPTLVKYTQLTFCIDNQALYNICANRLHILNSTNSDANHLLAHAMAGVTACLRFPGQLNSGLRKLYVNMVPLPQLHFLVPGFTPLISTQDENNTCDQLTAQEMILQIFNVNNMFAAIDSSNYKIITVAGIFRGLISPQDVGNFLDKMKRKNRNIFCNWIPNNIKTAFCDIPPLGLDISATIISNTTGLVKLFSHIDEKFNAMYNRKAYLHSYNENGVEEEQFLDCRETLQSLLQEYNEQCIDLSIGDYNCCMNSVDPELNIKMLSNARRPEIQKFTNLDRKEIELKNIKYINKSLINAPSKKTEEHCVTCNPFSVFAEKPEKKKTKINIIEKFNVLIKARSSTTNDSNMLKENKRKLKRSHSKINKSATKIRQLPQAELMEKRSSQLRAKSTSKEL